MNLQVGVKALLKRGDTFLFLRRSINFDAGVQNWDIPGGRIEPQESLTDALAREVIEETSLKLEEIEQLLDAQDIFVAGKDLHVVRLTYMAHADGEVAVSDEHDEYRWMTVQEVLSEPNVDPYLQKVLAKL